MKFKLIASVAVLSLMLSGAAFAQTCPTHPYPLSNGSTADASQVMADLNNILNCANTNLAPLANPHFTGNVGIGTSSPSFPLDIGSGSGQKVVRINGGAATDGGSAIWLTNGGAITNAIGNFSSIYGGAFNTSLVLYAASVPIILAGGNVGISTTTPSYPLHVNGTAYAVGAAGALSDIRHKDKVETLKPGSLNIVRKLRPVTFVWKDPKDDGMKGVQIGFIAQEVQKVLPDVVLTEKDKDKTLGLKYTEIIPVLVAAIQEQQAQIKTQQAQIETLKTQVAALKAGH